MIRNTDELRRWLAAGFRIATQGADAVHVAGKGLIVNSTKLQRALVASGKVAADFDEVHRFLRDKVKLVFENPNNPTEIIIGEVFNHDYPRRRRAQEIINGSAISDEELNNFGLSNQVNKSSASPTLKKKIETIYESTFTRYVALPGTLGEGGSGKVLKVKDEDGKEYALKLLNPNSSTEKTKRFKNELFFCLKQTHPNIVKIIDHGVYVADEKRFPFYVMPLHLPFRNSLKERFRQRISFGYFSQILRWRRMCSSLVHYPSRSEA